MKIRVIVLLVVGAVLAGFVDVSAQNKDENVLFTVDFEEGQVLKYKFVSSREIKTEWKSDKLKSPRNKVQPDMSMERVEYIMAYKPTKVDKFGLSTIEATCEFVKVNRAGKGTRAFREAVLSMKDKSFTFTVDARGKMIDKGALDSFLKKIGEEAFVKGAKTRTKEPDMISDVVASQWFLWDAVSSIENPSEGVSVGDSWDSVLSVPTPMVMRHARDVKYTLKNVKEKDGCDVALIGAKYSAADKVPVGWPVPYMGTFQMKGTYGFLRGYMMKSLEGEGKEVFNIDKGTVESYEQNFKMVITASAMGLASTETTIDHKLTMELVK